MCSVPTASTEAPDTGSVKGAGTKPRARRTVVTSPAITRTTESSAGAWILRPWSRNTSAIPASRRQRLAIVARRRLVGGVAAGHHLQRRPVRQQQVLQRRRGEEDPQLRKPRRHAGRDL